MNSWMAEWIPKEILFVRKATVWAEWSFFCNSSVVPFDICTFERITIYSYQTRTHLTDKGSAMNSYPRVLALNWDIWSTLLLKNMLLFTCDVICHLAWENLTHLLVNFLFVGFILQSYDGYLLLSHPWPRDLWVALHDLLYPISLLTDNVCSNCL